METPKRDKRPRISNKNITATIVTPTEKYSMNSSTRTGVQFHKTKIDIDVELWFDKHCNERQILRGLESDTLQDLTVRCINHIFYYQLRYPDIILIQYPENRGIKYRFVLQERDQNGELLNIATEIHYVDIGIYEITLVTAMIVDNFNVFDNQIVIRVDGESSRLYRFVNKQLKEIASYGTS